MKYIWELIGKENLTFLPADQASPFLELGLDTDDNSHEDHVRVNGNYRFAPICESLFEDEEDKNSPIQKMLFDLIFHELAWVDTWEGLDHTEIACYIEQDLLLKGNYGEKCAKVYGQFSKKERYFIAASHVKQDTKRATMWNYVSMMAHLLNDCRIYRSRLKKNEIIIVIEMEQNHKMEDKIWLITELFCPLGLTTRIFWNRKLGIIDEKDWMNIDQIEIY